MTLTIAQILDCKPGMEKLLQATVPAATALRIARLAQKITAEHKTAYEECLKLFERYGTRNEAGSIQVAEDRVEEFRRELEPFLATEVNVEVDRIPLAGIEQVAMTAGEIGSIEVFLLVGDTVG